MTTDSQQTPTSQTSRRANEKRRLWPFGRRTAKSLGERGESAAERFLRRKRLKVIGRRERDRLGELDLVVTDGKRVIFVEVKTRSTRAGGEPLEAVGADKQRRITRAAMGFLSRHGLIERPARFDVVSVVWEDSARPEISHFENAFEAVGTGQMFN